jgi:L-2-hydroxyglutarate oxidase LhgO
MEVDVLIIGAGVVGLASGAELAASGRSVVLVERHDGPGRETSSRNSEIIHAGLYYPAGSNKAVLCVEGRRLLYERCERLHVPYRRTGKFVVACAESELSELESLRERGRANGAGALELIDAAALQRAEPRVRAAGALWSPESGIVDGHSLMSSYQAELESHGGTVVLHTTVTALTPRVSGGWTVETHAPDGESFSVQADWVVNAAGLEAHRVAELAGIDVDAAGLRQHPCKGDYFAVAPGLGELTRHLIYPVPVRGGLGIHVTLDLGGRFRLGPDVEWVDHPRYDVAPEKAEVFAEAVQRYLPELRSEHLTPDFAGIRPKLQRPGDPFRDFYIGEASALGAPQLINLAGIESPGLTAAAALARRVAALLS